MTDIIRARAPLRLGLFGGGTDLSPYCDQYGGVVINATINKYAYITIKERNDNLIHFYAEDLGKEEKYNISDFRYSKSSLILHYHLYKYMMDNYNSGNFIALSIISYSEVLPGSGLGSSSTIVVALIKAFIEYFQHGLDDYEIAKLAYKIERIHCKIEGGRQDHYSASFGGFNLIEFYSNEKAFVNPLKIKNWIMCELEASIILYFNGKSRLSSEIILDQIKNYNSSTESIIENMHSIKNDTYKFKEYLLKGDFKLMADSIKKSWHHKKQTSQKICPSYMDDIYNVALKEGAKAGKISGAGGGGFMWFIVDPEKKKNIIKNLIKFGGYVSTCKFTQKGCESWRI